MKVKRILLVCVFAIILVLTLSACTINLTTGNMPDTHTVHTPVTDKAVAPTCTATGLTEGMHCAECGDILVKQEIIPVSTEHTYDDEYDAVCNLCGHTREVSCAHTMFETLPAKDATCKESGLTEGKKCSDCGEILVEQQVLPATEDHSFVDRVCEICGEINYSKGLAYTVIDSETCYISGIGSCTDLDIKIPEYIDGYKVISIGEQAFYDCDRFTSIIIPDSVTSIGYSAFYGCSSLESITVEKGNAVYHSAGNCLIETATKTLIAGCKNSIIPTDGSVTSIGDYAFNGCYSLTSINIPDSVTSIGAGAFAYCNSLTSVKLPDSVTSIGDYAFEWCNSLTRVKLPYSVTSIGNGAFQNCSSLTIIVIPDSVTSIGDFAFSYCSSLTSIAIPDSVTSIGNRAFYYCSSLTSVKLPDSVTSIGVGAFRGCSSLTSIEFGGTKAQWNAISKGSDWNYETGDYTVHCTDGIIYYY